MALLDPSLTLSAPAAVTAIAGYDAKQVIMTITLRAPLAGREDRG